MTRIIALLKNVRTGKYRKILLMSKKSLNKDGVFYAIKNEMLSDENLISYDYTVFDHVNFHSAEDLKIPYDF